MDDNGVYELRIFAPDIPDLHNQKVHASNSNFFIGLPGPSTYCPRMMESSCPDNPDTLVYGQMRAMAVSLAYFSPFFPVLS